MKGVIRGALALALAANLAMPLTALADQSFYKEAYPASYFLTNIGQVTPVKLQSPWEDCWAFAVAAAIESSILKAQAAGEDDPYVSSGDGAAGVAAGDASSDASAATAGVVADADPYVSVGGADAAVEAANDPYVSVARNDEAPGVLDVEGDPVLSAAAGTPKLTGLPSDIDISERALAWFAHEPQSAESGGAQAGEGYHLLDPGNQFKQLSEGNFEMVESQLIAGQSLLFESSAPYQYNGYDGNPGWWRMTALTGSADDPRGRDWSIDGSLRTVEEIGWRVTHVYKLSSPAVLEYDTDYADYRYKGYYAPGTRAIKGALMDVGAVAIALESDLHLPSEVAAGRGGDAAGASDHFNYGQWSQYNAAEYVFDNHAVAIVGWDDAYPAANFAGTASGQPPADGAWLCKNNWGSDALYAQLGATGEASHWGIVDDAEGATGFFWLSYYDHSIASPTAFGVDPIVTAGPAVGEVTRGPAGYVANATNIYQYDYLGPAEYRTPTAYDSDVWVANAFTAESTELLREVTAQTFGEEQTVEVQIWHVGADVDLAEDAAKDIFSQAQMVAEVTEVFPHAGFHHILLEEPVLVSSGEHFIVAERVTGTATDPQGLAYKANYLNLELAFTQNAPGDPKTTLATVVANPGETFVSLDGIWESIADFNTLYSAPMVDAGNPPEVVFGNALAKAYSSPTTISARGQLYETLILTSSQQNEMVNLAENAATNTAAGSDGSGTSTDGTGADDASDTGTGEA